VSTETHATPTSGGAAGLEAGAKKRTVKAPPRPRRDGSTWDSVTPATSHPRVRIGPEPRLRQLVGVCVWAAVIGGVALVTGIRALIGSLGAGPPSWYEPSVISVGLGGLALTVAAFATVNRRWIPFALLGAATVTLVVALNLTAHAF
jgi:hypothetical protein